MTRLSGSQRRLARRVIRALANEPGGHGLTDWRPAPGRAVTATPTWPGAPRSITFQPLEDGRIGCIANYAIGGRQQVAVLDPDGSGWASPIIATEAGFN